MIKAKRILAGVAAFSFVFVAASCGSKDGKKDDSSYVDQVKVEDTQEIEAIPEGAENTIEWLSYFDLNPGKGQQEKSVELDLFEKKGGKIHYNPTTSLTKFDTLAERKLANDVPDMFWYESYCFPVNCMKDMFQPIDEIVNFDDPLWADMKGTADQFVLNGKHYVAPFKFVANSVLTYDKDMVEAAALDDPYELYLNGEWNWDTFYNMMDEYVSGAEGDEERFGVNGWLANFIFYSTGHTLIEYDAEKDEYFSNIDDPNFDRASTLLYDIKKNNLVYYDWIGQASDCFKKNILFYAMGPWASCDIHTPSDGNNWGSVPMPKDPEADKQYITVETDAYMWISGSTKKEAMKCWMECARTAYSDPEYLEVSKEKFFVKNPNWTEDMYHVGYEEYASENWTRIVDPGYGISVVLSNDNAATNATKEAIISYMYTSVMKTDDDGKQYTWTQLRETYKGTIESELKSFNEEYKKFVASGK